MSIFTNSSVVKTQIEAFRGAPGPIGPTGPAGSDYVLTEADKEEIAGMAAELVEVPEGGGGNSGGDVNDFYEEETILASGTIPAETPGGTLTETGLTLGDLKKWKSFACLTVCGETAYVRMALGKEPNYFYNISGLRPYQYISWENIDRTIVSVEAGGVSGPLADIGSPFLQRQCNFFNGKSFTDLSSLPDDTPVYMQNHSVTNLDYQYKISGIFKFKEVSE